MKTTIHNVNSVNHNCQSRTVEVEHCSTSDIHVYNPPSQNEVVSSFERSELLVRMFDELDANDLSSLSQSILDDTSPELDSAYKSMCFSLVNQDMSANEAKALYDMLQATRVYPAQKPKNIGKLAYQPLDDIDRLLEDRQKIIKVGKFAAKMSDAIVPFDTSLAAKIEHVIVSEFFPDGNYVQPEQTCVEARTRTPIPTLRREAFSRKFPGLCSWEACQLDQDGSRESMLMATSGVLTLHSADSHAQELVSSVRNMLRIIDVHPSVKLSNRGKLTYQPFDDYDRLVNDKQKVTSDPEMLASKVIQWAVENSTSLNSSAVREWYANDTHRNLTRLFRSRMSS